VPVHVIQFWELFVAVISSIGLLPLLFIILSALLYFILPIIFAVSFLKRAYYNIRKPKRLLIMLFVAFMLVPVLLFVYFNI
jgi:hypothetical protein